MANKTTPPAAPKLNADGTPRKTKTRKELPPKEAARKKLLKLEFDIKDVEMTLVEMKADYAVAKAEYEKLIAPPVVA